MNQEGLKALLVQRFGESSLKTQETTDEILTLWISQSDTIDVLKFLKTGIPQPFSFLFDLTAIDERNRKHANGQSGIDFTIVYHLFSYERNTFIRIKVGLKGEYPTHPTISFFWENANWYEREVFDMFGI